MNRFKFSFLLAIMFLGLCSCSKNLRYYTSQMQEQFEWSDNDLKRIQFYLSEDIILRRARRGGRTKIQNGQIEVREDGKVEEIKFKKGTPGTVVFAPKEDRVAVSFESGSDKFLMFGANQKAQGRFVLLAKDWDKSQGTVSYDGKEYQTSYESAYAGLLLQIKNGNEVVFKSRKAGGSRVRR